MTMSELQQKILALVLDATKAVTVDLYAGKFSAKDVDKTCLPMPAALLACTGFKPDKEFGLPHAIADMAVAILVNGDKRPQRNLKAQAMAERLLLAIDASDLTRHSDPDVVNMYDEACDERGCAFYLVTWQQTVQLTTPDDPSITDFDHMYASWSVVPKAEQDGKPQAEALISLNPTPKELP